MPHRQVLAKDKKLKAIVGALPPVEVAARPGLFDGLVRSVMSQQLSTKVADNLYKKYRKLFTGRAPGPEQLLQLSFDKLRAIGLSNQKTTYLFNIASFFTENKTQLRKISSMSDEEIISFLTQIKGVGRWTAEMILMFQLGRTDVFPADDYGIQVAMKKLYQLDDSNKKTFKQQMIRLSTKWSPYRTYACIYLWRWKDQNPLK